AAEPAVEPKSIDPALRNSSALFDPADCTQTMRMPSLANSCSSSPFCLRIIDTGLYVAQSRWISLGASAAAAPPGTSAETAMTAAKARREILNIVGSSMEVGRSSRWRTGVDVDGSIAKRRGCENIVLFQLVMRIVNEKI